MEEKRRKDGGGGEAEKRESGYNHRCARACMKKFSISGFIIESNISGELPALVGAVVVAVVV